MSNKLPSLSTHVDRSTNIAFVNVCKINKTTPCDMLRKFVDFVIASQLPGFIIPPSTGTLVQNKEIVNFLNKHK